MNVRTFIIAAGSAVALLGILLILVFPVSVTMTLTKVSCGTVSTPDESGLFGTDATYEFTYGTAALQRGGSATAACADALSTRQGWSWALTGLGAVVAIGAAVTKRAEGKPAVDSV
jgi:hypothetical protein